MLTVKFKRIQRKKVFSCDAEKMEKNKEKFGLKEFFAKIIFFAFLILCICAVFFADAGYTSFWMRMIDGIFLIPFTVYCAFNFVKF